MNRSLLVSLAVIVAAAAVVLILTSPRPKSFALTEFSYGKIVDIKGFTEGPKNAFNPDSLAAQYKLVRAGAKTKAGSFIRQRNNLNIAYHVLCVLTIVSSLVVSYLGATKGLLLDPARLESQLEKVQQQEMSFRKAVIFLSILSLVLTTVSNRVVSYYDKTQNKATEVIELIKNADIRMASALNLTEVANIVSSLELDIEKY
jgi:hypothetical protein